MAVKIGKSELVKRDARGCACGRTPTWVKIRGGFVLACPDSSCELYLAVRGPTLPEAINTWNKEVQRRDTVRKRH